MNKTIHPASRVKRHIWLDGELVAADDQVATETPVAMVYNGISHVVMMSTPCDLEDFVTGFSLSEGIITGTKQLLDVEEITTDKGIELHATITAEAFVRLKERRRNLVGRTGCGLCGAESLDQAIPRPKTVNSLLQLSHKALQRAVARNHFTLDGFVLVTSRASYEMVSKAASANICLLAAVSAPTSLAINLAKECGLSLVGFSRQGRHVIYSNEQRLVGETP